jgi:ribosome biogenesis GTPase / thiamine phosphate phosphatase
MPRRWRGSLTRFSGLQELTGYTLTDLGWSDHFARLAVGHDGLSPARVTGVARDVLTLLSPEGEARVTPKESTGAFAVGDWVMTDGVRIVVRLAPKGEIARRAAGAVAERQLIAANVDTLAIVTSCNADFNAARIERYLAVALGAGALPLVVLTKADGVDDPGQYVREAQRLSPLVTALALDAREGEEVARLDAWCERGQTLALVGSSGVGKTTLQNALTGVADATQGIREDDAKGRHTTTARALRRTTAGGWLIDTPGMRELQLTDAAEGIAEVFGDIAELAAECRFSDCRHEGEPGCAVQAAIAAGVLEEARLNRYRKLEREDRFNSEAVHERHARARAWARATRHGRERSVAKRRGPEG